MFLFAFQGYLGGVVWHGLVLGVWRFSLMHSVFACLIWHLEVHSLTGSAVSLLSGVYVSAPLVVFECVRLGGLVAALGVIVLIACGRGCIRSTHHC